MSRLDDQVAIVTGAGSGTGAAIATQLAAEGASVVCTDLDGAEQTTAPLGKRGRAVRLDVADAGSVARLMAEVRESHGRLDVLFNCAGVDGMVRPLTELSEENFELVMRVNLKGPFLMMKHAIPHPDLPGDHGRHAQGSPRRPAQPAGDPPARPRRRGGRCGRLSGKRRRLLSDRRRAADRRWLPGRLSGTAEPAPLPARRGRAWAGDSGAQLAKQAAGQRR